MAFDPNRQARANVFRDDLARLEAAAERLGWPEASGGASLLIRRICADWLERATGDTLGGPESELPTIAELEARVARLEAKASHHAQR